MTSTRSSRRLRRAGRHVREQRRGDRLPRLVAKYPNDVRTLVAHEPPFASLVPDREHALAANRAIYGPTWRAASGPAMAQFMPIVMHGGPVRPGGRRGAGHRSGDVRHAAEDDGVRTDLMLAHNVRYLNGYEPDFDALRRASTRIVAAGEESNGNLAARRLGAAERLGQEAIRFPGDHGAFMGGEYGQPPGKPVEFAAASARCLPRPEPARREQTPRPSPPRGGGRIHPVNPQRLGERSSRTPSHGSRPPGTAQHPPSAPKGRCSSPVRTTGSLPAGASPCPPPPPGGGEAPGRAPRAGPPPPRRSAGRPRPPPDRAGPGPSPRPLPGPRGRSVGLPPWRLPGPPRARACTTAPRTRAAPRRPSPRRGARSGSPPPRPPSGATPASLSAEAARPVFRARPRSSSPPEAPHPPPRRLTPPPPPPRAPPGPGPNRGPPLSSTLAAPPPPHPAAELVPPSPPSPPSPRPHREPVRGARSTPRGRPGSVTPSPPPAPDHPRVEAGQCPPRRWVPSRREGSPPPLRPGLAPRGRRRADRQFGFPLSALRRAPPHRG